jgi:hypothetical protein
MREVRMGLKLVKLKLRGVTGDMIGEVEGGTLRTEHVIEGETDSVHMLWLYYTLDGSGILIQLTTIYL